mmetsp:Transcript_7272/g.21261  ORF Transcript_7272/g.21261 Transcript_7272/m.21261 type:complete len:262 (+) Transcript_7272:1131-1916(+)
MGRGELKGLVRRLAQNEELDGRAPITPFLAEPRDHLGALGGLGFTHDLEGALGLVEALEEEAHHGVHVLGRLVGARRVLVLPIRLLCSRILELELGRGDLVHQLASGCPVFKLDVDGGRAVGESRLLVEHGGVLPLLHALEDLRAVAAEAGVVRAERHLHPARDLANAHEAASYTRLANALQVRVAALAPALVHVECRQEVAAHLEVRRELLGDRGHLFGRERWSKHEGRLPVEEVLAHLECTPGVGRGEEELLRLLVLAE